MKGGKRNQGQENRRGLSYPLSLVPFFLLPLTLAACGKHSGKKDGDKKKKEEPPIVQSVALGAGDTTVYKSSDPNAPVSFTVKWEKGGFKAAKEGIETGHLTTVSGDLFSNGKKSSTYQADRGDAVREKKLLTMTGDVTLRANDGKGTLVAPKAEYRGDVGLVRAMGGVTAKGPFGTLSGVPEMWATPDLRLIGTPDMVSNKLKIPALVALAATAAVGGAKLQNGNDYVFSNVGPIRAENLTGGGYRITAKPKPGGPLVVTMPSRGLVIRSAGTVVILTDSKGVEVRHMTSEGAVNVVKTVPTGTTTIDGTGSVYESAAGTESSTLDLGGPVTIVNASKGPKGSQTTVGKGQKGRALLLNRPGSSSNGLKSATLTGDVRIESKSSGNDTFTGTGNRLVYSPAAETADVDLEGNVVLTRVTKGPDGSNTVVSKGSRAHAVLDPTPGADENPMKNAVLDGGVSIDVSGTNGQTFKGSGDRVVYTASGEGGKAVMTGNLKFSGDAPSFLGNVQDADTAVVQIGKNGWKTVDLDNSGGKPTTTTIQTKPKPPTPKPPAKRKKGGNP